MELTFTFYNILHIAGDANGDRWQGSIHWGRSRRPRCGRTSLSNLQYEQEMSPSVGNFIWFLLSSWLFTFLCSEMSYTNLNSNFCSILKRRIELNLPSLCRKSRNYYWKDGCSIFVFLLLYTKGRNIVAAISTYENLQSDLEAQKTECSMSLVLFWFVPCCRAVFRIIFPPHSCSVTCSRWRTARPFHARVS